MAARQRSQGSKSYVTVEPIGATYGRVVGVLVPAGSCPPPYQYEHWHYVEQIYPWTAAGVSGCSSDYEEMNDFTGNWGGFNSCLHIREQSFHVNKELVTIPCPTLDVHDGGNYWRICSRSLGHVNQVYSPVYHWNGAWVYPPYSPSPDWASLVQTVGDQLSGKMATGTNILVTLCQLAQTIRMFKNPFGLLKLRKLRLNTPLGAMKFTANSYLEYRYGWKQLFRDVSSFATAYRDCQNHIQYLLSTKDQWAPIHASESGEVPYNLSYPVIGTSNLSFTVTDARIKWKATFGCEILRGKSFQTVTCMEAMMQRLGCNDVLSALWDLVPFSFVVDWFINITDVLETDPAFWGRYRLRRMGYSVDQQYCCGLNVESYANTDFSGGYIFKTGTYPPVAVAKRFERVSGFPPDCSAIGLFEDLNITNFAAGAALIAQRL